MEIKEASNRYAGNSCCDTSKLKRKNNSNVFQNQEAICVEDNFHFIQNKIPRMVGQKFVAADIEDIDPLVPTISSSISGSAQGNNLPNVTQKKEILCPPSHRLVQIMSRMKTSPRRSMQPIEHGKTKLLDIPNNLRISSPQQLGKSLVAASKSKSNCSGPKKITTVQKLPTMKPKLDTMVQNEISTGMSGLTTASDTKKIATKSQHSVQPKSPKATKGRGSRNCTKVGSPNHQIVDPALLTCFRRIDSTPNISKKFEDISAVTAVAHDDEVNIGLNRLIPFYLNERFTSFSEFKTRLQFYQREHQIQFSLKEKVNIIEAMLSGALKPHSRIEHDLDSLQLFSARYECVGFQNMQLLPTEASALDIRQSLCMMKIPCPALIHLQLLPVLSESSSILQQLLVIVELNEKHNHERGFGCTSNPEVADDVATGVNRAAPEALEAMPSMPIIPHMAMPFPSPGMLRVIQPPLSPCATVSPMNGTTSGSWISHPVVAAPSYQINPSPSVNNTNSTGMIHSNSVYSTSISAQINTNLGSVRVSNINATPMGVLSVQSVANVSGEDEKPVATAVAESVVMSDYDIEVVAEFNRRSSPPDGSVIADLSISTALACTDAKETIHKLVSDDSPITKVSNSELNVSCESSEKIQRIMIEKIPDEFTFKIFEPSTSMTTAPIWPSVSQRKHWNGVKGGQGKRPRGIPVSASSFHGYKDAAILKAAQADKFLIDAVKCGEVGEGFVGGASMMLALLEQYFSETFYRKVMQATRRKCEESLGATNITMHDVKAFFGTTLLMSVCRLPEPMMYWGETTTRLPMVASWSYAKYQLVAEFLTVQEPNEAIGKVGHPLAQIDYVFRCVRNRCLAFDRTESVAVDEHQIELSPRIETKHFACSTNQHSVNSPVGLPFFVLVSAEGLLIDVYLFRNAKELLANVDDLGLEKTPLLREAAVLQFIKWVPEGTSFYFDSSFTTPFLLDTLQQKHYHATGIVYKSNITHSVVVKDQEVARQKGRGYSLMRFINPNLGVTAWLDSQLIYFSSTEHGLEPQDSVQKWCESTASYIEVSRPAVAKAYAKGMEGADIFDQALHMFQPNVTTSNWSVKVIVYLFHIACVNAWLEYRLECQKAGVTGLTQAQFRLLLANCLIKKDGGLCLSSNLPEGDSESPVLKKPLQSSANNSDTEVSLAEEPLHLAVVYRGAPGEASPNQCNYGKCGHTTDVYCKTCGMHLCLTAERNCFYAYHCIEVGSTRRKRPPGTKKVSKISSTSNKTHRKDLCDSQLSSANSEKESFPLMNKSFGSLHRESTDTDGSIDSDAMPAVSVLMPKHSDVVVAENVNVKQENLQLLFPNDVVWVDDEFDDKKVLTNLFENRVRSKPANKVKKINKKLCVGDKSKAFSSMKELETEIKLKEGMQLCGMEKVKWHFVEEKSYEELQLEVEEITDSDES